MHYEVLAKGEKIPPPLNPQTVTKQTTKTITKVVTFAVADSIRVCDVRVSFPIIDDDFIGKTSRQEVRSSSIRLTETKGLIHSSMTAVKQYKEIS